jgi:hypothetical protein
VATIYKNSRRAVNDQRLRELDKNYTWLVNDMREKGDRERTTRREIQESLTVDVIS